MIRASTPSACLALAAVAASLLAGCSSGPGQITTHGKLTVDYNQDTSDDLTDGTQVTVVNSAGAVIGNAVLSLAKSGGTPWGLGQEDKFTFKVTVPGGLPRYGIQVGGTGHGTLWQSEKQMETGPGISINEINGDGF